MNIPLNRRKADDDPFLPNPWSKHSGKVRVRTATPEEQERFGIKGAKEGGKKRKGS